MLHHLCNLGDPQTKGDKIRIGCLTPAFSGAQKWAEMLYYPVILGDPQTKGDIRIGCLTPEAANSDFVTFCLGIPETDGVA